MKLREFKQKNVQNKEKCEEKWTKKDQDVAAAPDDDDESKASFRSRSAPSILAAFAPKSPLPTRDLDLASTTTTSASASASEEEDAAAARVETRNTKSSRKRSKRVVAVPCSVPASALTSVTSQSPRERASRSRAEKTAPFFFAAADIEEDEEEEEGTMSGLRPG